MNWPFAAYISLTWAYAIDRARELATEYNMHMFVYQFTFEGKNCWVVSFDPKKETP